MKPANFPRRKAKRKLEAEARQAAFDKKYPTAEAKLAAKRKHKV